MHCKAPPETKNGSVFTCTPQNKIGGYDCACMTGYTGAKCVEDVDECARTPCGEGGTCTVR